MLNVCTTNPNKSEWCVLSSIRLNTTKLNLTDSGATSLERLDDGKTITTGWYDRNSSSSSSERMELTSSDVRHNRLCGALQQLEELRVCVALIKLRVCTCARAHGEVSLDNSMSVPLYVRRAHTIYFCLSVRMWPRVPACVSVRTCQEAGDYAG